MVRDVALTVNILACRLLAMVRVSGSSGAGFGLVERSMPQVEYWGRALKERMLSLPVRVAE